MVKKEENIKQQNKNFNKKQKKANKNSNIGNITDKKSAPVPLKESVKDHFFTFNLKIDLFTILYSTIVFKWIQTDRVNLMLYF
jgi:hypothetical protein